MAATIPAFSARHSDVAGIQIISNALAATIFSGFTRQKIQRAGRSLQAFLWLASRWNQQSSAQGILYSVLTGMCVGAGTIGFFLLFQKGGPLSSVPAILVGGAAIMAIAGILFFREAPSWQRIAGIAFAIIGFVFAAQIVSEATKLRGLRGIPRIVSIGVMM